MKVAIVGSSGYIAGFLLSKLESNININKILKIDQYDNADIHLDLQNPDKFSYEILDEIDYVIFTAAISGPDQCALKYDLCWSINVTGTSYFINEAINRNCKVLFFSSDAVYGEIQGYIYDEKSVTKATTAYGKMKKNVEDMFKKNSNFKTIRLSYVVSTKDRFVSYCLNCLKNDRTAEVFHPFYRNCVVISDVVNVVCWLLFHWKEHESYVLNVAGSELVSRVRIADEINRYFGNRLKYVIIRPEDIFYKNRPPITQMKSLYIGQYGIINETSFTEKLQKELEEIEL